MAAAALSMAPLAQAQVGLATLQVAEMPVTMLYPTAHASVPTTVGPFDIEVARDAVPLPGVRRLVVLSHGTGGSPLADHALAAMLVRAGFVVAQPLHQGDNHLDSTRAGPDAWARRPNEVSRTIDALALHPLWQNRLALDRVGVHGMSAGGLTALALAGAQWRTLDLVRHCQTHDAADFGFCFNGLADKQAQAARRARYDAARGVPEFLLPADVKAVHGGRTPAERGGDARPDPRVAVATAAVPVGAIFSAESLARIRIPVGVVTAGHDTMLVPAFHSARVLAECGSCSEIAALAGAAHMDLLWPWPASVASATAAQHPRGGAPQPGFDARERNRAFDRIADFHRRALGP